MSCEGFRELISAEIDGELSPVEEASLVEHLAGCSSCQVHRKRLKKTVAAVRGLDPALVGVPEDAPDVVLERLDGSEDPCAPFREQISAGIDGELDAAEEEALLAHLTTCSACHRQRGRLRKNVERIRNLALPLLPVGAEAFMALEARLEELVSEVAPPLELAEPKKAPALRVVRGEAEPAPRPQSSRRGGALRDARGALLPQGQLPVWRRFGHWVAAAAILAVAGGLFATRYDEIRAAFLRFEGQDKPDPTYQEGLPDEPEIAQDPDAPLVPDPTPDPDDASEPVIDDPPEPDLPDDPDEPLPDVQPEPDAPDVPDDPEIPDTQPDPDGTRTRPQVTPVRPKIQLAELRAKHKRILDKRLAAHVRVEHLQSLGAERFDHPENYRFLAGVLGGKLDRYEHPHSCRAATYEALGALGTVDAVRVLLASPLRKDLHHDEDAAGLMAALTGLQNETAISMLAATLAERSTSKVDAYLVVEALGRLARPVAFEGLLAVFVDEGREPRLRRQAGQALGRLGSPKCVGPLKAGLESKKPLVRQGAAWGLGLLAARSETDADECVLALASALDDRQPLVREAALDALGTSRHTAAIEPLLASLNRDDLPRRERARLATRARVQLVGLAGKRGENVRKPEGWRVLFAGRPQGRIPNLPFEELDLSSFRRYPGESQGVVFVIDTSGSMASKWELVLFELEKALETCTGRVRFQVIFFSDAPRLWTNRGLQPATAAAKASALEAARNQKVLPVAKTAIDRSLELALQYREAETIYLISDGLQTSGRLPTLVRGIHRLNVLRQRPAAIHVVHLRDGGRHVLLQPQGPQDGEPEDIVFMRGLAWENGGVYAHN